MQSNMNVYQYIKETLKYLASKFNSDSFIHLNNNALKN